MQAADIDNAARLLVAARRDRKPIPTLPEASRPKDFAEAVKVQEASLKLLGGTVAAYKVAGADPAASTWGSILSSLLMQSPARMNAVDAPLLGMEAEVAFRLDRDVGADEKSWTRETFDPIVTALPALEVVATRFSSYDETPLELRMADMMSNGALIVGEAFASWKDVDLAKLPVKLSFSGKTIADTVGGHATGDPRVPAIAFLNSPLRGFPLAKGTIITTGTYTGMISAKPGDTVEAVLGPLGTIRAEFPA